MSLSDLTGQTFGRLTVVSLLPTRYRTETLWRCRCSCGNWVPAARGPKLKAGRVKSCGCLRSDKGKSWGEKRAVHGLTHKSGNSHYTRWQSIKQRLFNPKNANYHLYGGRGIGMLDAWKDDFVAFKAWLDDNLGPCPDGHSVDRIDVNGDYCPGNLRWADSSTQTRNRRCRSRN